jgi:hypothetical protein
LLATQGATPPPPGVHSPMNFAHVPDAPQCTGWRSRGLPCG